MDAVVINQQLTCLFSIFIISQSQFTDGRRPFSMHATHSISFFFFFMYPAPASHPAQIVSCPGLWVSYIETASWRTFSETPFQLCSFAFNTLKSKNTCEPDQSILSTSENLTVRNALIPYQNLNDLELQ